MKKIFSFLTLGLAVLASSCSDSDEPAVSGGNAPANTVAITCQVPTNSIHSRGADANGFYGDGAEATHLVYAVYNADGEKVLSSDDPGAPVASFVGGKFTVYLPTTYSSNGYSIFLWADAWGHDAGTPFTFDWAAKTVTVNYQKSLLMGEKADAFYTYGKLNKNTFTLTRPFEQIAVATFTSEKSQFAGLDYGEIFFEFAARDIAAEAFGDDSQIHDDFMPTGFNFETGDIILSDGDGWVSFALTNGTFSLNGKDYAHLFVGYFFAPKTGDDMSIAFDTSRVINFYFHATGSNGSEYEKDFTVMAQTGRNIRTLILPKLNTPGLLTSSGQYDVVISPEMGTSQVTK